MRSFSIAGALAALALGLAACGGGDDDDGDGGSEEQARQAVTDTIAAYDERDFETVCEFLDERGRDSIAEVTEQDTCADAYEFLYANERELGGKDQPYTAFADLLQTYEVGEATLTDAGAEVELTGPGGPATSFLVEEDGELKVSELFVTPDAGANPGGFTLPEDQE